MTRLVRTVAVAASVGAAALGAATSAAAVTYTIQDPGDGAVTALFAPTAASFGYQITGSNDGVAARETGFTITAGATEELTITGSFLYVSTDRDGSVWDPLLQLVNGIESDLITVPIAPFLPVTGSFSFTVLAGQSASFFIRSVDGILGPAFSTISGTIQIAAVPLPAAGLMLLAALGALAVRRRRALPN